MKVLGDIRAVNHNGVAAGLKDPASRVRFFAALAAGKRGDPDAIAPVIAMLKANADADPYLRHAA